MSQNKESLVSLFERSVRDNWDLMALSDYSGASFAYRDAGEKIIRIHRLFTETGVKRGDKVALLGKNSAMWGITYIATITYGAVIVPILPDFKPADVQFILTHSDSVLLFADDFLFKDLQTDAIPAIGLAINIQDHAVLFARTPETGKKAEEAFRLHSESISKGIDPTRLAFAPCGGDDVAVISYTSGTTGFSKGVVIQHKSLLGNILFAHRNMPLNPRDKILSFLPLAHTYGCAFEFLFPFTKGCDITFLTKTPSPKIIMQAFQEIRPALILSVPLVIEKIYKAQIIPAMRKPAVKILSRIPGLNQVIFKKIREKLFGVFGGNFRELVIGGAPFNAEAERFFRKIRFPFTVGYGMTECGPLISYASWKTTRLGASGRVVDELEVKIDDPNPRTHIGEILVKGSHVMQGYYKNEEATRQVLESDGWLHTGDLGVIDDKGNIHIKGRSKSMILGPSGKNIYPEELESILNNRFMVMESLVIERGDQLVALIVPDKDAMEKAGVTRENLPEVYKGYLHDLNHHVPKYMAVASFEITETEFEKTPKRSIKRFLYK
jgi:long-chain acyl-CoA synthetase